MQKDWLARVVVFSSVLLRNNDDFVTFLKPEFAPNLDVYGIQCKIIHLINYNFFGTESYRLAIIDFRLVTSVRR